MGEHGNHKSVHVATLGILLQYLRAILGRQEYFAWHPVRLPVRLQERHRRNGR